MLKNAHLLAKIGVDRAENGQNFAEILTNFVKQAAAEDDVYDVTTGDWLRGSSSAIRAESIPCRSRRLPTFGLTQSRANSAGQRGGRGGRQGGAGNLR